MTLGVLWDDLVARYNRVADVGGAKQVNSAYLVYAEAELNSLLGSCFTVPFSDNNLTAKDLVIDLAYLRVLSFKADKMSDKFEKRIMDRIDGLKKGDIGMTLVDGTIIFSSGGAAGSAVSSTQDFTPAFNMLDELDQRVDPDRIDDEYDDL